MTGSVEPVQLLLDSLKIYSPTSKEAPYADFLVGKMEKMGYSKVHVDRAGNAVGQVGRGNVKVLLCGHMDTVPGELPVRHTGDSIYGRGAADAKSPLCSLLVAGAEASDSGVSITFAGVTEEEGDGAGINQIMEGTADFDYAVFGEPGGASRITIAYRGRVAVQIAIRTEGGHAGSPWAYRSAFQEFNATLSKLREYEESKQVHGDRFRSMSLTPTLVRAGVYQNVVPNLCEATLDVRLPLGMPASKAIADIRRGAERKEDGLSVRVNAGEPTEAYEVDSASPILRAFQRAIILKLKERPGLIRKTSTGDMNTFAHRKRTECITYGPGLSNTSHTGGEVVQIADYLNSIEVLKEALHQLAALEKRTGK